MLTADQAVQAVDGIARHLASLTDDGSVPSQGEVEFVLATLLVAFGHQGTSVREVYPQVFTARIGGHRYDVAVADLVRAIGFPPRRFVRYYANTLFDLAVRHGIVFEWGVRNGLAANMVAHGFDAVEFVTDPRVIPAYVEAVAIIRRRLLPSEGAPPAEAASRQGVQRIGIGWDPAAHLGPGSEYARRG
jgi:hypothetical protein